tara:strand:+ start:8580 stop:9431 length:852 start_codon:yes stop_codon:yes gene_type:complete
MKKSIKFFLGTCVTFIISKLQKIGIGRFIVDKILETIMNTEFHVKNEICDLRFLVPNSVNHMRGDTFFTKEPETLEWIDSMPESNILWDIGANVGIYSCYAAQTKNSTVYAFEPSVFNLELLARNIFQNDLTKKITIVTLPLYENITNSTLNMTSLELGGALSTFDKNFGDDGNVLKKIFEYRTIGISMEDSLNLLKIPQPDFIKMDVDGIEHIILKGGLSILNEVKGILIEVNYDFEHQANEVSSILTQAGLKLIDKRQADLISSSDRFGNTFNQIWKRIDA